MESIFNIQNQYLEQSATLVEMKKKKRILNQIPLSKLWHIGQIYTITKFTKNILKKQYKITLEQKRNMIFQAPYSAFHLEVWARYLNIVTQLNSLKLKWIQRLLNSTNALWKSLILYELKLKLNSNEGLALFKQKQIIKSTRNKNLQSQNNENFFRKHNAIFTITSNTHDKTQSLNCQRSFS